MKADCHCHTHFSDGALSVNDLLERAQSQNLNGLCITDHDTLAAYDTALAIAPQHHLDLISGVEISSEHNKQNVHVLGFAFNLKNVPLIQFLEKIHKTREERNQKILDKLEKLKMPIAMAELKERFPIGIIGRPHIAKCMIAKGYVKTFKKAFEQYLGSKGKAYVSGCFVSVEEAISVIQQAGGFAVLAHPHRIQSKKLINDLLAHPFDGIEAYYANLPQAQATAWVTVAQKKNWLVTGGSDFHEENNYGLDLGSSFTPETTWAILKERYLANH